MTAFDRLGPWPPRVLWLVLAVLGPVAIGDALDGRSTPVVLTVAIGAWLGWTAAAAALLIRRDVALTAARTLVPGGLAAVVVSAALGSEVDATDLVAVAVAALATMVLFTPTIGAQWVDGSSYGPEQRFPLRAPVLVGSVLAPVTWVLVVLAVTTGPLLLASRQWAFGALATLVGAAIASAGLRSLHQLARRWIVLVPVGLVIHDPLTMPEPQLVLRRMIDRLGPAPADTDADDLTAGAAGLALQIDLREPLDLLVRNRGRGTEARSSTRLICTPSQPNRLLEAARDRRIPIG